MTCQRTRDILPDLLDERSVSGAASEARAHLAGCVGCQRELAGLTETATALDTMPLPQPSPRLRQNFYAMVEAEKQADAINPLASARPQGPMRPAGWRWFFVPFAACALLAVGFFTGRQATPVQVADDTATRTELKKLQEQVNKMGRLVGYSLLQQQQGPANDRLRGVLASAQAEKPSDKVLDDLISALAFDPNANIRLRALEALSSHADRALVRAGVLAALPREQNPLVQLELIDFVAAARDRAAAPALERLAQSEGADRSVRDAASLALARF
ncbi:MAG: hypothetical protein ABIQ12_14610 [Opitutaceae bacterium]